MPVLLGLTVVLIVKLASRWASPAAAWVGALCYLVSTPVLVHGGSFRADSMLAPLTVGVLLLVMSPRRTRPAMVFAGICTGLAFVISVKAAFLLPLLVFVQFFGARSAAFSGRRCRSFLDGIT